MFNSKTPSTYPVVKPFDYGDLKPSDAQEAQEVAARIRARMEAAMLETGRDLARMKERLEHGNFLKWIKAEFAMTPRTAQKYMNAADVFSGKYEPSSYLPPSLLYDVASPSFPLDTREDVLQRLQPGERPDVPALVDMVKRAKQELRQQRQAELRRAEKSTMASALALEGHKQEGAASQPHSAPHAVVLALDDVRAAADIIVLALGERVTSLLQVLGEHSSITRDDLAAAAERLVKARHVSSPEIPPFLDRRTQM